MPIPFMEMGEGFASGEDVMARSEEPLNGSEHPAQNGVKARRAAIVLFIVATFGIMAVLSLPLTRNIRLPLPRPLQSALSPAERLIRPILPWLGPLTGSPTTPGPGQVSAGRRPISQPPPPQRGSSRPQPGPPSEEPPPPPPPPGGDDVRKERTTLPPAPGTVAGTVVKAPPPPRPGSGTPLGASGPSTTARERVGEDAAKPRKHAKPGKHVKNKKHAKHRKRGKHAKKAKNGTTANQGNGRKKG